MHTGETAFVSTKTLLIYVITKNRFFSLKYLMYYNDYLDVDVSGRSEKHTI